MQTLKVIFTIFSRYAINVSIKLIISFTSYCKTTCLGSNRQNEFINRVISLDFNDSCVFSPSLLAFCYRKPCAIKHLWALDSTHSTKWITFILYPQLHTLWFVILCRNLFLFVFRLNCRHIRCLVAQLPHTMHTQTPTTRPFRRNALHSLESVRALLSFFILIKIKTDICEIPFFYQCFFFHFRYTQAHQVFSTVHHQAHHVHIQMVTATYSFHVAAAVVAVARVAHQCNHQHRQASAHTMTTDPLNGHPEVVTVGQDEGKQKFSFSFSFLSIFYPPLFTLWETT